MVIFNSYVTMFNYQRVYPIKMGDLGVPPWITKPLLGPHRGTAQIIGHPSSIPPMPRKQTFGEFGWVRPFGDSCPVKHHSSEVPVRLRQNLSQKKYPILSYLICQLSIISGLVGKTHNDIFDLSQSHVMYLDIHNIILWYPIVPPYFDSQFTPLYFCDGLNSTSSVFSG